MFRIAFLDNSPLRIYPSIESLRAPEHDLYFFDNEDSLNEALKESLPHVLLVSLNLSPNDGISVLKDLRSRDSLSSLFIVVYGDKTDDFMQETIFNTGGDAFITFHRKPALLKLFLRNLLRRTPTKATREKEFYLDVESFLVYQHGKPVQLPRKEFRILECLSKNGGAFTSKQEIAIFVWQDETVAARRAIDVHVYNIRKLLGKRLIQSRKGKGYRLNHTLLSP